MTRRLLGIITVCSVIGGPCSTALSMPPAMGRPAGRGRPAKVDMAESHKELVGLLKLTDKQAPVVEKILADYRKDVEVWEKKIAPEAERLNRQTKMFHRTNSAKAMRAVKAAVMRLGQIRAQGKKKHDAMVEKLKGVLTKEQMATVSEFFSPRRAIGASPSKFHLISQLGLTGPQKAKLKTIMAELRAAEATAKPKAKAIAQRKAWSRIITEILTEANQQKLRDLMQEASFRRMSGAMLGNIELTTGQIERIDLIWKAAHKKAVADPKQKFTIYGAAQGEIVAKVLTDSQRKQMRSRRGGGMGSAPPSGMHK